MVRAHRRDAVNTERFFFRKDVFPPGVPSPLVTPLSTPHASGANSPVEPDGAGGYPRRARKLQNCFAEVPRPAPGDGFAFGPVSDEYDEYTLKEIFHGKVRVPVLILYGAVDGRLTGALVVVAVALVPRAARTRVLVPGHAGR